MIDFVHCNEDSEADAAEIIRHLNHKFRRAFRRADPVRLRDAAATSRCKVLIALFGENWTGYQNAFWSPISIALKQRAVVIPVLVKGAPKLSRDGVPNGLEALARRDPISLTDESWNAALEKLSMRVREAVAPTSRAILVLNLVLFLFAGAWLGSWLSSATNVGEEISAQWAVPLLAQMILVLWGVVVRLFPEGPNLLTVRHTASRIRVSIVLVVILSVFFGAFSSIPVFVLQNSSEEAVDVTFYERNTDDVNRWRILRTIRVRPRTAWKTPFLPRSEGSGLIADCSTPLRGGYEVTLALRKTDRRESDYPLQRQCITATMAPPLIGRLMGAMPQPFEYPNDAERTLDVLTIEMGDSVYKVMDEKKAHLNPIGRLIIEMKPKNGKKTLIKEIPISELRIGLTATLPPGTQKIIRTSSRPARCMSYQEMAPKDIPSLPEHVEVHGFDDHAFGLPPDYEVGYRFVMAPPPSTYSEADKRNWPAGFPPTADLRSMKYVGDATYCLEFE